jgi:hypothetical protein
VGVAPTVGVVGVVGVVATVGAVGASAVVGVAGAFGASLQALKRAIVNRIKRFFFILINEFKE